MASFSALLDNIEEKPTNSNQKKFHFENEIQRMMFACGDSNKPLLETVHLVEKIVHQQMASLLIQAQEVAEMREAKFIKPEDFLFLMRGNRIKLRRAIKYLCFNDLKNNLCTGLGVNVEKKHVPGSKRRSLCMDFLRTLDSSGELMEWVDSDQVVDEVKDERNRRADRIATNLDCDGYFAFSQARSQAFYTSHSSTRLRAWLFQSGNFLGDPTKPQLPPGPGVHMELLGYLAKDTLAEIVDMALLLRRDALASTWDPINRLMPPTQCSYVNLPTMKTEYASQKQETGDNVLSSPSKETKPKLVKLEGTPPITPREIQEVIRRFRTPLSAFSLFKRSCQPPMDRRLFCM